MIKRLSNHQQKRKQDETSSPIRKQLGDSAQLDMCLAKHPIPDGA